MLAANSPGCASRTPAPLKRSGTPTSTRRTPAVPTARSYMFRCERATRNSARRRGTRSIRAASSPATMAVAPSSSAAAAPEVAMPASAPVAAAISRQAAACRSRMSAQDAPASRIASATSGCSGAPERRVLAPTPLTMGCTPRRPRTLTPTASDAPRRAIPRGAHQPPGAP